MENLAVKEKRERQKNSEDPRSQREKPENPRNIKGFYFLLCNSFNNIKFCFILFFILINISLPSISFLSPTTAANSYSENISFAPLPPLNQNYNRALCGPSATLRDFPTTYPL